MLTTVPGVVGVSYFWWPQPVVVEAEAAGAGDERRGKPPLRYKVRVLKGGRYCSNATDTPLSACDPSDFDECDVVCVFVCGDGVQPRRTVGGGLQTRRAAVRWLPEGGGVTRRSLQSSAWM